MFEDVIWSQKHRPRTIDECVLPKNLKKTLNDVVSLGEIPNMIFFGKSGTGKTTAALAICDQLSIKPLILNGSGRDRGVDTVKETVENFASTIEFDGKRRCVVFDEFDNATHDAQLALRAVIEKHSKNCSFVFTCNFPNRIIDAIKSRCSEHAFNHDFQRDRDLLKEALLSLFSILEKENVKFEKKAVIKLFQRFSPDLRKTINELQKLSSIGEIIDENLIGGNSSQREFDSLLKLLKEKRWSDIRGWVNDGNHSVDEIIEFFFENGKKIFADDGISFAKAVLVLQQYQYESHFSVNSDVCLMAMFTKLMMECDFK